MSKEKNLDIVWEEIETVVKTIEVNKSLGYHTKDLETLLGYLYLAVGLNREGECCD